MMDIMEKITDKENWHKKVLDDEIVAKWRKEALAISDDAWRRLATHGKNQDWSYFELEGVMNEETFEVVSYASPQIERHTHGITTSVCRSFVVKPSTLKRQELFQHLMPPHRWPSPIL